ncbi:MAG: phosphate signaling complex protein PhoU [Candidatus Methylacidiphilales bacterium]|nr:phosphate signaling complex protein PhoU [Candidatus Methylacidiphilales bacterium]
MIAPEQPQPSGERPAAINERLEHNRGIFRGPLLRIKDHLLMMASLTDRNLNIALQAFLTRDDGKADLVESEDAVIDRLEIEIDELVVTYVSTHGPMATTCRLAIMSSKMCESLESIADQAVTIARRARLLNVLPEPPVNLEIAKLANLVLAMMREAIVAFVDVDPDSARALVGRDKEVDAINKANEAALYSAMVADPAHIPACLHLMFVSRSLERVGDYAKNLAQDVVYLYTAQDIRHRGASGQSKI